MVMAVLFVVGPASAVGKWGDTGTVAGVSESDRIIVVEIPRGSERLTVGGELAEDAVLKADGKKVDLSGIEVGDRVRIEWSCGDSGCVVHKVVVLQPGR